MPNTIEITSKNQETETWSNEKINQLLGLTDDEKDLETVEEESTNLIEGTEEKAQAKKTGTLANNPYMKLGLIAAICGMGVLFLGLFLTSAPSFKSLSVKHDKTTQEKVDKPKNTAEEQIAVYKAQAAISTQSQQIKEMGERLDSDAPLPQPVIEKEVLVQKIQPAPPVAVKQNVVKNKPVYRSQPQPIKIPTPVKSNFNRVATLPPKPTINPQKPNIDPHHQWQQLAQLGSYTASTMTDSTVYNEQKFPPATKVLENPQKVEKTSNRSPVILTSQRQNTEEELLGETQDNSRVISVGTTVKAQIVTSLIWADGMETADPFVVVLSEPLRDARGVEVLPSGTEIIFAVSEIHDSGMIQSNAIAIRINGNDIDLPPGVFGLRANKGKPLIAKLRNDASSQVATRDAMGFVVGALASVGEVVNRPSSTSSSSGYGGFSQSSTYDDPNLLGAIAEGGFEPLSEQMQRRNQKEIDQLSERERLWYLGEGTKVQIQVNRTLEF